MNARGIAQLIVLWALLLLGSLALSFAYAMRTEALASRNGLDGERAYYQARTGISRTLALLAAMPPDNVARTRIAGGGEDASYEVRLESESGRIDINIVADDVLKEVLGKGGLTAEEVESVGDAILDWRDGDDEPRERGAEDADYAALPEPIRPRNGKLESLEELRFVRGVTPALFRDFLSRVFTVYGHARAVNVNAAPVEVLQALPGFTPEFAARVVSRRGEAPFRMPAEVAVLPGGEAIPAGRLSLLSVVPGSNIYAIAATGRAGGGVVRVIRCVVEIGSFGAKPVKILRWADHVSSVGEAG